MHFLAASITFSWIVYTPKRQLSHIRRDIIPHIKLPEGFLTRMLTHFFSSSNDHLAKYITMEMNEPLQTIRQSLRHRGFFRTP